MSNEVETLVALARGADFPVYPSASFPKGEKLGEGCNRACWAVQGTEELVIKTIVHTRSVVAGSQQLREFVFWLTATEQEREHLCPLIAVTDKGELVFRRAEETDRAYNYENYEEWMKKCKPLLADRAKRKVYGYDLHGGNVGIFEGRVVVIDYGVTLDVTIVNELVEGVLR